MARKILLADDSVTAQNMGRKILTDAGYEVITVNNGSAALKRVAEHRPDLIVLDVYMPGYSGLEVCQRLKDSQDTSRIPVLLTVGKLEPFKAEEARRVNADAFIVKPFEASELLGALTRLEDRIVPQAESSRFSASVSGIERFNAEAGYGRKGAVESDTSWKSRLRFPSQKPKVEEPEEEPAPQAFRDFRHGSAKAAPSTPSPAPHQKQEPGLVPEIPRDITPEELDALSALAAKLDGPIPETEDIVPISGKLGTPGSTPPTPDKSAAETASAVPSAAPSPDSEKSAAETAPVAGAETTAPASTQAPEVTGAAPAAAHTEISKDDYRPAPVDRDDEPLFSQAPTASEVEAEPEATNQSEVKIQEIPAPPSDKPVVAEQAPAATEPVAGIKTEAEDETNMESGAPASAGAQAEELSPATRLEETATAEHIPTEEELAEALRLLTPSHAAIERQSNTEAIAHPAVIEQETANGPRSSGQTRWLAEAVALTPEESAISLEAEMFQRFAPPAEAAPPTAEALPAEQENISTQPAEEELGPQATSSVVPVVAEEPSQPEAPEPAAVTFADAVQREQEELAAGPTAAASETSALASSSSEQDQEPISEAHAGGQDEMGKDKKSKSGWHQIRSTPAPSPAAADPVQAAKESTEEAPKAMAASASTDGASAGAVSEASAIASIVDSVLADLRPKIVEEIAKKLAKKD